MKLRGTKYVWSQIARFNTLYYARKDWATCLVDIEGKGYGDVLRFNPPKQAPFGTFKFVLSHPEPISSLIWVRKRWGTNSRYDRLVERLKP